MKRNSLRAEFLSIRADLATKLHSKFLGILSAGKHAAPHNRFPHYMILTSVRFPRIKLTPAAAAIALALLPSFGLSQSNSPTATATEKSHRFALGAQIGSAGYGPVAVFTASKHFTATVGYTMLDYDRDIEEDDADYNGKLKLSNVQALLNWHPFAGKFHLSAGAFISNNKVDVLGRPKANGTYTIDGATYTTAEIGTLSGQAKIVKGAVPYVGLGWTKTPDKGGFGVSFSVGICFMDAPTVHITSQGGTLSSNPTLQQHLRAEERDINDDLKPLRYYPAVQLGILYRF